VPDRRSDVPRVGAALELKAKGAQEFQNGPAVGPQRGLLLAPGLGVRQGLVDAPSAAGRPLNDAPVDQEQKDRRPLMQGRTGPEVGAGQVVLQVKPCISSRLFQEGKTMLVVAMSGVVSEASSPVTGELIHK
jgi:hypothetical protein